MLRRLALLTAALSLLTVGLSGCVTINVGGGSETAVTPSSTPTEVSKPDDEAEAVDDTAALKALVSSIRALYGWVETHSAEDCSYLATVAGMMNQATPLDEYRGSYEAVATNIGLIVGVCSSSAGTPGKDVTDLAIQARDDAITIVNDRNYLGGGWGVKDPVPGSKAG